MRVSKIIRVIEDAGGKDVLGFLPDARIPGLESMRGLCSKAGIGSADVVLVPLEDGDRAEALTAMGTKTIAIDLNPMSRTSKAATVTVVDEVTRAIPEITRCAESLEGDAVGMRKALSAYDRDDNLGKVMAGMAANLRRVERG